MYVIRISFAHLSYSSHEHNASNAIHTRFCMFTKFARSVASVLAFVAPGSCPHALNNLWTISSCVVTGDKFETFCFRHTAAQHRESKIPSQSRWQSSKESCRSVNSCASLSPRVALCGLVTNLCRDGKISFSLQDPNEKARECLSKNHSNRACIPAIMLRRSPICLLCLHSLVPCNHATDDNVYPVKMLLKTGQYSKRTLSVSSIAAIFSWSVYCC